MFIDATKLSQALTRITAIASMDKTQPGILFDIGLDTIEIYYNTQSKAIKSKVPVILEDGDITGKVIFDYKRLTDTINSCKTSGNIKVENIEFKLTKNLTGVGTAIVRVVKMVDTVVINESGEPSTESMVVCTNNYELSWWNVEQISVKQKILIQPVCEDMFGEAGATLWSKDELCRVLNASITDDAKIIYMSPKYNGAFAINTNSTVYVKSNAEVNKIIQLASNSVKAITNVLATVSSEDVMLNTIDSEDGKLFACIIFTPDKEVSVYMGAAAISQTHLVSMARYSGFDYKSFQANVMTEVIKDVLKTAVNLSASTKGKIEFVRNEDGNVEAVIKAVDTGASVSNNYKVRCASFYTTEENETSDKLLSVDVDLKLLLDIINNSRMEYTGLDMSFFESNIMLRVGFINLEKAVEARDAYKHTHEIEGELTVEDKMSVRDSYIDTCYYVVVKNG